MLRHGVQIQPAAGWKNQASKISNRKFNWGLSEGSIQFKSSGIVLLLRLPIPYKVLMPPRLCICYKSKITLRKLLFWALWSRGWVQAATQLQIGHCEDRMHWLRSCAMICVVLGNVSGTLKSGWMSDNLEIFGEVLGHISNNPSCHLKHPGVPAGSGGADGTSYPLTENYTLPVPQPTVSIGYIPPLLCAGIRIIRTTCGLHSLQGQQSCCSRLPNALRC